jgi:hypothetical protein
MGLVNTEFFRARTRPIARFPKMRAALPNTAPSERFSSDTLAGEDPDLNLRIESGGTATLRQVAAATDVARSAVPQLDLSFPPAQTIHHGIKGS